jgi:hypothetical protein
MRSKRPTIPIKITRLDGIAKKPSNFERTKNMGAFPTRRSHGSSLSSFGKTRRTASNRFSCGHRKLHAELTGGRVWIGDGWAEKRARPCRPQVVCVNTRELRQSFVISHPKRLSPDSRRGRMDPAPISASLHHCRKLHLNQSNHWSGSWFTIVTSASNNIFGGLLSKSSPTFAKKPAISVYMSLMDF